MQEKGNKSLADQVVPGDDARKRDNEGEEILPMDLTGAEKTIRDMKGI